MNKCKKCTQLIEKALYDELKNDEFTFFYEHVRNCVECSTEFDELKNTLSLIKSQPRQEPDAVFINNFWETLEPNLSKKKKSLGIRYKEYLISLRYAFTWKYQLAGALTILFIGIFIGKYFTGEQTGQIQYSVPGNEKKAAEQTKINAEAINYIERSKVLLLGLMNFDPATDDVEAISLPRQKQISRELLTQAAGLKTELKNPSEQQLKKLVSDIELILLQIANLETQNDLSGIELIKDGVNTRGIFLKINIEEMKENIKESTPQTKSTQNGNKKI